MSPKLQTPALAPALPRAAGLCLKAEHYAEVLAAGAGVAFLEVHAENYFHAGGPAHRHLEAIRARHALSIHGVALSLGGSDAPDPGHLARLRELLGRYEPQEFSEHLAWTAAAGVYLNDLLPLPYTPASLDRICEHIDATQTALGRRLLLENPATYLRFTASEIPETEFLALIAARTGCGLLLDVNNVQVCAVNHGFDASAYIDAFPLSQVGQIHLAGHARNHDAAGNLLLIDAHDRAVDPAVWSLYEYTLARSGPLPTLIEWDNALPAFVVLREQAAQAQRRLEQLSRQHAAA
jgi:uncharacterized protein (UPF0276 family)